MLCSNGLFRSLHGRFLRSGAFFRICFLGGVAGGGSLQQLIVLHDLLRGCLAVVDLQYTEYLFLLFRCSYCGFGGGVLLGLGLAFFLGTALIGVDEAVKSLAVMVGVVGDGRRRGTRKW